MVSLTLRALLPRAGIAFYMYCTDNLNSLTSVLKTDGKRSCSCWESKVCFAGVNQLARSDGAKQKSTMDATAVRY